MPATTISKKPKSWVGLFYIMPWLIGFLVLQAYPILSSLFYSFSEFDMMNPPVMVGLNNYVLMFTDDPDFLASLGLTFQYVLYAVPLKLAFALAVAMLLNAKMKGINFFRTLYYLPSILGGSVAVALLWRFLFVQEGAINSVLALVGLPAVPWLTSPAVALFTLSLLTVWQFGSSMVLFLAGLQQIPQELYEAGKVDGASRPRMFFAITLPMLTPILFFNLIMQMVNAFQEFTGAFVITNGGPMKSTYLYVMKLYQEGFMYFKLGYASALSWVLFVIIIVATSIAFKSSNTWVHYADGGKK